MPSPPKLIGRTREGGDGSPTLQKKRRTASTPSCEVERNLDVGLAMVNAEEDNICRGVRLQKGVVILKGFLTTEEQQLLAGQVHSLGQRQPGGFYPCHNEKTKRMRMMNLGLRTDGGEHVLPIPQGWKDFALRACMAAKEVDSSLPVLKPDVCVVNHYNSASKLGWHQDLTSSRDPGLPVISFSLGNTAVFEYRVSWRQAAAVKSLHLESGDALVFGGRSRGIIHRVSQIEKTPTRTPAPLIVLGSDATGLDVVHGNGGVRVDKHGCSDIIGESSQRGESAVEEEAAGRYCGGVSLQMPEGGRYNLNLREL
ncbi:unnamed protein product [Choristocarpus tenellus]